jgi:DNA end-binding protein Ku
MSRSFWTGYLRLSLLTCPVAMMPAASEYDKARLHIQSPKIGSREVAPGPGGIEAAGDDDVGISRIIDIELFVPAGAIERVCFRA